jgi:hypothetical protein
MERLVTGLLLGLALFWSGACLCLNTGLWLGQGAIPDWWLPVAFAAGIALAIRLPQAAAAEAPLQPTPRWASGAAWLVVGTAFAVLAQGSLATTSRHWDGAAAFDAKVFWLTNAPTLQQPFFAAEGVFHHSPDYPLLLPLLVSMTERLATDFGRIVLPLVYLLLCGVVTTALQQRAIQPLLRLAVTVAVAVTPALLNPGGGAVDSGYSECLLLLATTTVAAGLLNRRSLWFAIGILLLVASKPEGLAYGAVALAVAFGRGERRLLGCGCAALATAGTIWEPVRAMLLHGAYSGTWLFLAPTLLVIGVVLATRPSDALFRGRERVRWILVLCPPFVALLSLPWLAPMFATSQSTAAVYLRQGHNVLQGLANLPAYAAGVLEFGITRLRLGLVLLLPIAALLAARQVRVRLAERSLMAFVLLGLLTTALPFVLSPDPDFDHHLRSSLPRLLLHWVGPLWLLNACWLQTITTHDKLADSAQASGSSADVL